MIRGIVAVLIGLLAVAFPFRAWFGMTIIIAVYALSDGMMALFAAGRSHRSRRVALIFRGVAGVLVGAAFLAAPFLAMVSVGVLGAVLIAIWCAATGGVEILSAVRHRKETRGELLLILYGALSICAALAVLVLLAVAPEWTMLSLAAIVGVIAVIGGIMLLAQGIGYWRLTWRMPRESAE
ncbi:HdeD family acid-resistance protein [Sphingomonas parva]|nr:DUF308 domain-containing protein [Sphingomonas parva]